MFDVRAVTSNQNGLHPRLDEYVLKHAKTLFQRPENHLQREIRTRLSPLILSSEQIILDTGCGKGESSFFLAEKFPNHLILAIDKSAARLEFVRKTRPSNLEIIRTDLIDFWLVAQQNNWRFEQTYLLYPNPWPKSEHAKKRWHMHAVFPSILACTTFLELRSNWAIYVQEFARAIELITEQNPGYTTFVPQTPITAFERKYILDGQELYQLQWFKAIQDANG